MRYNTEWKKRLLQSNPWLMSPYVRMYGKSQPTQVNRRKLNEESISTKSEKNDHSFFSMGSFGKENGKWGWKGGVPYYLDSDGNFSQILTLGKEFPTFEFPKFFDFNELLSYAQRVEYNGEEKEFTSSCKTSFVFQPCCAANGKTYLNLSHVACFKSTSQSSGFC